MTENSLYRTQLGTIIVFSVLFLFGMIVVILQPVFSTSYNGFELTVRIINIGYPYLMPGYTVTAGPTTLYIASSEFDDDDKAKVKFILNKFELYATESVCIRDEITFRPICKYFDTYGDEVTVNFYVR